MRRKIILAAVGLIVVAAPQFLFQSPIHANVSSIAGLCLFLWISELAPPFVPTLLLWALIPLLLAPYDPNFALPMVLAEAADPVMALFFGGFALGIAAERSGLGGRLTRSALRIANDSYPRFLFLVIGITAFFSMWISNIAAAALVFACLHPVLESLDENHILRRNLLIGVALGANFGGIATPVGTGPNAIAIASIASTTPVSFLGWMTFAFPLTVGLLLMSFLFLLWRVWRKRGDWKPTTEPISNTVTNDRSVRVAFPLLLASTAVMWIAEPLHGIPAAVIALGAAAILFVSGMLSRQDLLRIDWSTLLLIAGGITLGKLLERSEIIKDLAERFPLSDINPLAAMFLLCFVSGDTVGIDEQYGHCRIADPACFCTVPRFVHGDPNRSFGFARLSIHHQHSAKCDGVWTRRSAIRRSVLARCDIDADRLHCCQPDGQSGGAEFRGYPLNEITNAAREQRVQNRVRDELPPLIQIRAAVPKSRGRASLRL